MDDKCEDTNDEELSVHDVDHPVRLEGQKYYVSPGID